MQLNRRFHAVFSLLAFLSVFTAGKTLAADWKVLPGHVPTVVSQLKASGRVVSTQQMNLAIGVPLRDETGLDQYLAELYDPASTNYQHFLTVDEITARFGATEEDYEAVKAYARTNGLIVSGTFSNRMVLDVSGPASAVEKAFHIVLRTYRHPTEGREFFAADADPVVRADLRVNDIQGLTDFYKPHPRLKKMDAMSMRAKDGSSPDGYGYYFGDDFRKAYAPGTTLTGAGQMVGLLQFDGFYSNDIAAYASAAGGGRSSIPIQTVLLDGYNGVPTTGANSGNSEVSLDIEMAMAMAPGLAKIVVFEGGPNGQPNDILNSMLSYSNTVKQLSCSWGWGGGPSTTTDGIFKSMAAAGQSFFDASGDSDAFTAGSGSANGVDNTSLANAPSSSPYITQVGGTTLATGTGASYSSEAVWNWGTEYGSQYDGNGSSGGVSSYYSMPSWQTNISNMASRGGSATNRNIPDVALTADNVYLIYGNGQSGGMGGTSCAAPLWAGFMALVNQQAAANGKPPVGFINPAIYALAGSANYSSCFHDVTSGNNTWSGSTSLFSATNGYDLCTGLGTPNGQNLINALAPSTAVLAVLVGTNGYAFGGLISGPFNPNSAPFVLTNASASGLNWSIINTSAWLNASFNAGSLAGHAVTNISVSLTAAANNLAAGSYSTMVAFTNTTSHTAQSFPMVLTVLAPITFNSAVRSSGNFQLAWNTTTGAVYQVQYKTNLSQANWINLGNATTATTTTMSLTDTNAVASSPQRFYRLSVVP